MNVIRVCSIILFLVGISLSGATITPEDRYKTDYTTNWTPDGTQTYTVSASASGCSFADSKTQASSGATVTNHSSSGASAEKNVTHSDVPNTSAFSFSVFGVLAGSGKGSEVTWSATLQQKFFWLTPQEKIVAEGTPVTVSANGTPTESKWNINNKEWKDWTASGCESYKTSSITLNRNMWDKMQWTPSNVSTNWRCPPAGIYNISATTTETSPNTPRSANATITVLGLRPLYYRIGNTGNFIAMEDYNDDGVYELIIPYHDQIISVGDELNKITKKSIDIFIKSSLQPSADAWPKGKPTWAGATIVSANDRSIAKLTVNDKGTSTVEVKYDDSYKITAKIYVVKVSYSKDSGNKYGFDEPYANHPQNDYNTYVSLKNNGDTKVKINLNPFPNDLDFYAQSSNDTRLKFGSSKEIKLSSTSSTVTLNGQSSGAANVFVYLKHKTDNSKNFTFPNSLNAKLYTEKTFNISLFKIGTTTGLDKDVINEAFRSIVYNVNNINNETFPTSGEPDINGNKDIDNFNNSPNKEVERISVGVSGKTNPVVLVNDLVDNYRALVTAVSATEVTVTVYGSDFGPTSCGVHKDSGPDGKTRTTLITSTPVISSSGNSFKFTYAGSDISIGDTIVFTTSTLAGLAISGATIIKASLGYNNKITIHELGHSIASFKDTNKDINNVRETVMQFNGALSANKDFSCRVVERVQTGSGNSYSPRAWESHWDNATR